MPNNITKEQIEARIDAILRDLEPILRTMLPRETGRLQQSFKISRTARGWRLEIDDGGFTEEQWNELSQKPEGVAPYAAGLNEVKPYWRRLAFYIRDRLVFELGIDQPTQYRPRD